MNELIFSWAEGANGRMVHVDDVPNGLNCGCFCPCCHEPLQARHGEIKAHGFAHHSKKRGANLKICYMVTMYKLAEQIIQDEKRIKVPSYYGFFLGGDCVFSNVTLDSQYDREDKQPDVVAFTPEGKRFLIEFTFANKVQHKGKIDYKDMYCIEIDLSSQTLETLRDFLLNSDKNRKWLNNQSCFQRIESLCAKHGKPVKITNETDCKKCILNTFCGGISCCGVKLKNNFHLIIENNGQTYRLCKIEEYEKYSEDLEWLKRTHSDCDQFFKQEREGFNDTDGSM
ncbi:MAG: hypothetical protein HDT07_06035 [Bacteroidales bacterium]|nr:hypothetical protein [Bacteroidales bacterium]